MFLEIQNHMGAGRGAIVLVLNAVDDNECGCRLCPEHKKVQQNLSAKGNVLLSNLKINSLG